jgi:ABC-2 type transport system permease protein
MTNFLEKWWSVFILNFKSSNAYRINSFSYLLAQLVVLATTIIIWFSNIQNGSSLFSLAEVITYYIVGQIFILQIDPHWSVSEDIQYGKFSTKLLKPTSVWVDYWIEDLAVNFFSNLVKILFALALLVVLKNYIIFPENFWMFGVFVLSLAIGYFINLLLSLFFGFLAFYTTNANGVLEFFNQLRLFCSGYLFPLNIVGFLGFFQYLPFAFTYYFSMQIWLNKLDFLQSLWLIAAGFVWLVVLFVATTVTYRLGLRKYESIGL